MENVVDIELEQTGKSQNENGMGMRAMQARVFEQKEQQYILVKAPPASGKSRALMYVALDKLTHQNIKKVIVAVPEKSIGGSFQSTSLKSGGFYADWEVNPNWNLCTDEYETKEVLKSKVKSVGVFLGGSDQVLVCTHATLRFAFDALDVEAFDNCLIAVDEFHHVSAHEENKLGEVVRELIRRGKSHLVAMTGSYFRGDTVLVMRPEDEAKFTSVTYTYYEQLNGYKHLTSLGIGHHFYEGVYLDSIGDVLDVSKKTIIHIPHVGSSASTGDKYTEVRKIYDIIGDFVGIDERTGFHLIKNKDTVLKVADLVDDGEKRAKIQGSLRSLENKDAVDIIIALGMAKEGFDWIWCEHALTVGYRSSLTEIVQIIGRATRDAPGKAHAQFTNLIPEPDATQETVIIAVNDLLKAIAASLLMEQVLAPSFKFHTKRNKDDKIKIDDGTGQISIAIKGLTEPTSKRVQQIVDNDMQELISSICQSRETSLHAAANPSITPEDVNRTLIPKVIAKQFPDLDDEQIGQLTQQAAVRINLSEVVKDKTADKDNVAGQNSLLAMVKKFVNVRELDIELIYGVNQFRTKYEIMAKDLDTKTLSQIQVAINDKKITVTEEEALATWPKIEDFLLKNKRYPSSFSTDAIEKRLGEIYEWLLRRKAERERQKRQHNKGGLN